MDASTRIMVESAQLQSRMTIPNAFHQDNTPHYRLVDSQAALKQREERDKIIREIEAKRASKRAAAKMPQPFEAALSVHGSKPRAKKAPHPDNAFRLSTSYQATTSKSLDDGEERANNTSTHEQAYIQQLEKELERLKMARQTKPVDNQVAQQLAEIKAVRLVTLSYLIAIQAQLRDLRVVEQLVREKEEAEKTIVKLKQELTKSPTKKRKYRRHVDTSTPVQNLNLSVEDDPAFDLSPGGDECLPDFDLGPRTASSVGEPPGFDDLESPKNTCQVAPKLDSKKWATPVSRPVVSPAASASTKRVNSSSKTNTVRSSAFFEAKERARREQLELEQIAREKLERAKRAAPPSGLLMNEAKLRERKQQHVEEILLEEEEKSQPFKARDPPKFDEPSDAELIEHLRKERVAARAAALLASSKVSSRLASAKKAKIIRQSPKKRIKAAPVPDFLMMQNEWKAALDRAKTKRTTTQIDQFSLTDPEKLARLQKKKQERIERQVEKEAAEVGPNRRAIEEERKMAYEKAMAAAASSSAQIAQTESQKLRTQAVQAKLKQRAAKEKAEAKAQQKREAKIKQLSKQVKAEVSTLERQRREEKGNFVDNPDEAAKAKAEESKRSFQEAIQRNKQRIMGAVAARPTLIERFAIDKKKEENKRQALAAVVSNVFGKNIGAFKGVLTDGEEDLVDAMDAQKSADEEAT
ncbi:hypothetical protein Ae201684_010633 [Aphanomyces euteiches]|uniref:Uncharacterized protein n=1 Tax=Aphanomyces euteiches TaxID=100861 RepID=A0A6G0WXZ2_9STRA|nr:hypothetical protein Ae201684_010633 [Aphanomyces euteiches]